MQLNSSHHPFPVPCIPERTRTKYLREVSRGATAPEVFGLLLFLSFFFFFFWQTAGERQSAAHGEQSEAIFAFSPNWESTFQQPDSPTGFPSFSVKSHSLAGDADGLK